MKLRKERAKWLLNLIIKYDMHEIDEQFYELLPNDEDANFVQDKEIQHPYDVNWKMYDSLQPLNNPASKEEAKHV